MSRATTSSEAMQDGPAAELTAALASCRGAFLATGLISGMSNVLMLTGAIFMLEIYDRVLPSRSVPSLIGIAVLAAALYVALGFLDLIRGRILARIGISLDEALSGRLYQTIVRLPLDRRAAKRRGSADARPGHRPGISGRHWSGRAIRFALDTGLSRNLLRVPFLDRHHGDDRSVDSDHSDPPDRMARAQADKRRRPSWRNCAIP